MKVIIPAAGKGTRLLPHTYAIPKPLIHVAGKPIIGHILNSLIKYGIDSVGFIINDNGNQINDYVKLNYDLNVDSVYQDQPNGLGYAVYIYLKDSKIDGPVLIVLGDTIFEADLSSVLGSQYSTIAVHNVNEPQRFGIVELENGFIKRLVEKPKNSMSDLAIVGIYFIKNPSLLLNCFEEMIKNDIRTKNEYQLTDALQMMVEKGERMTAFHVDEWHDCGDYDALLQTNRILLSRTQANKNDDIYGSIIIHPVSIAKSAVIENSIIGPYVSIADSVKVSKSIIEDSIIEGHADIRNALIKESLIGRNAVFNGQSSRLNIGDYSKIMNVGEHTSAIVGKI